MKKIAILLFLAALLCVLAACPDDLITMLGNSVTIGGTVTITRNSIPWNSNNFSQYRYSRSSGPRTDIPTIYAHFQDGSWIDSASVYYQPDSDDYRNGTYQWKLKIPADKLPCSVYFQVSCTMRDVVSGLATNTEEFWIQDKNTVVDIGLINFDVVRISGNLPITINNKPLGDYNDDGDYAVGRMNIFNLNGGPIVNGQRYPSWTVSITPDGDWSLSIAQPHSELSLEFQVEVKQNGGYLMKMLDTDDVITLYDTDTEIVFPNYPSVNLEAFLLSGTIEVVSPGFGESRYYSIRFFREGTEFIGGNLDDYRPWGSLLSDTTTGWSASGRKTWKTTIPVLELPHELVYTFAFAKGGNGYQGHSSVTITDNTDLSNLNLGIFTFE